MLNSRKMGCWWFLPLTKEIKANAKLAMITTRATDIFEVEFLALIKGNNLIWKKKFHN